MFQDIVHSIGIKIAAFITILTVAVGSLLPQATPNPIKYTEISIASPSASISATPSAKLASSAAKQKPSPTPQFVYDGSRTGPIIEYNELCTGKKISIQANEKIHYTDRSGKEYLLTTGDIHCLVLNDCKNIIKDLPKDTDPEVGDQIEKLQRNRDIQKKASTEVVNQYYEWRYKFCKEDKTCQKNAEDEKNQLLDKCREV